ncbi:hypothetical protein BS50DRAFT_639044 [Corynespora cassiicola Philippines]|uniref:Gfd2/YDR514C-like C-terminal domain-containing protein n=1 Tax=Corynespora cassiicola Philippines TaxID=1448308 RepID=A0A2T2N8L8_CORCC|nr:hypothetical protein BS50DRAFT_639044 [Corynespora cassiicola Philippines]
MLKKLDVFHLRILETCHLCNYLGAFQDREMMFRFGNTCFVDREMAKKMLESQLNLRDTDGNPAPVIIIGHGYKFDQVHLKREWHLDITKFGSIEIRGKKHVHMIENFGIEIRDYHNGGNDAVYEMNTSLLFALFTKLYPDAGNKYPEDSSISGRILTQILSDVSEVQLAKEQHDWGFEKFCFYCDTLNDHDTCPERRAGIPPCQLCSNVRGASNARYRKKASTHLTSRCHLAKRHNLPSLPEWVVNNLSDEDWISWAAYPDDRMGEREVRVATGEAGEEQAALDKLEAAR